MASAKAVLGALRAPGFLAEVSDKAAYLTTLLTDKILGKPAVKAIRNLGLMVGIELDDDQSVVSVLTAARTEGLLVLSAGHNVIRLLPPLVITKEQLADGVQILEDIL